MGRSWARRPTCSCTSPRATGCPGAPRWAAWPPRCSRTTGKKWAGDHIIDPAAVPGVLLMNRPFRQDGARLVDLAPTILAALGVPERSRDGREFAVIMKILVLGLDCAAPELLFGDERLENFRRLMGAGCYGRLESVVPPITVPAWMCMATSQDPGSLGIYGFRNRVDHSYEGLGIVNSRSIDDLAIWDQVARDGKKSVIIGVPPGYPPRKINGVAVGCFLTPDTDKEVFTHPPEVSDEIRQLVGHYPVDVKRVPHRGQGVAPRPDLRDEPDPVSGRAALPPEQGMGATSSSSISAWTACTTGSGSTTTRSTSTTSRTARSRTSSATITATSTPSWVRSWS